MKARARLCLSVSFLLFLALPLGAHPPTAREPLFLPGLPLEEGSYFAPGVRAVL